MTFLANTKKKTSSGIAGEKIEQPVVEILLLWYIIVNPPPLFFTVFLERVQSKKVTKPPTAK